MPEPLPIQVELEEHVGGGVRIYFWCEGDPQRNRYVDLSPEEFELAFPRLQDLWRARRRNYSYLSYRGRR